MKTFSFLLASALFFVGSVASAQDARSLTVTQTSSVTGSIPLGANRVPVMQLSLQASCSAPVTIQSITVHHKGLGALTDIAKVYVLEGTTRLSRGSILQKQTGTAILRLSHITIPACKTRVFVVAMDLSATAAAGSEHTLSLESAEDIATNAAVTVQAKTTTTTSIAPSSRGGVTFAIVPLASQNTLFGKGRTLLRFSLKANNDTNQLIDAITFTNDGSATNSDLQNLAIFSTNGEQVSDTISSLDGDIVRISFSTPLLLQKNALRLLTLRGDVTASRRRTIRLTVEETSDIEAHTEVRGRSSVN